jgi:hypothetical protein
MYEKLEEDEGEEAFLPNNQLSKDLNITNRIMRKFIRIVVVWNSLY